MFGVSWPYGSQLNSICFKKGAVWKRLGANPKEEEAWSEPFSLAVIWTPWTPRFRGDTNKVTNKVTWYLIYSWLSVFHSIYILTVYLQFRINLTMYLLALMIYLVTIVSAKKKARMIFFRQTRIYKILQNIDNIAFKTKRFCSLNCYFKSHAIKIKYIFLLSILIKN